MDGNPYQSPAVHQAPSNKLPLREQVMGVVAVAMFSLAFLLIVVLFALSALLVVST